MLKKAGLAALIVAAPVAYQIGQGSGAVGVLEAPDSVVRVETDSGLGSGVLISDHVILTAAHVVENDKDGIVDIKTEDGGLFMGEVLWQSKQYDVAAIRVEKIDGIKPSPLAAENPKIGDEVVVSGNPLGHLFFRLWGHVLGFLEVIGFWR